MARFGDASVTIAGWHGFGLLTLALSHHMSKPESYQVDAISVLFPVSAPAENSDPARLPVSGDEIRDPGLGCLMLGILLSHPCCLVAGWLARVQPSKRTQGPVWTPC